MPPKKANIGRITRHALRQKQRRERETPEERQARLIESETRAGRFLEERRRLWDMLGIAFNPSLVPERPKRSRLETPGQRRSRLEAGRIRSRERRATETPEERAIRLESQRIRLAHIRALQRATETEEERNARLLKNRIRTAERRAQLRATETDEQRKARLEICRIRAAQYRALARIGESEEQRRARLQAHRAQNARIRALTRIYEAVGEEVIVPDQVLFDNEEETPNEVRQIVLKRENLQADAVSEVASVGEPFPIGKLEPEVLDENPPIISDREVHEDSEKVGSNVNYEGTIEQAVTTNCELNIGVSGQPCNESMANSNFDHDSSADVQAMTLCPTADLQVDRLRKHGTSGNFTDENMIEHRGISSASVLVSHVASTTDHQKLKSSLINSNNISRLLKSQESNDEGTAEQRFLCSLCPLITSRHDELETHYRIIHCASLHLANLKQER